MNNSSTNTKDKIAKIVSTIFFPVFNSLITFLLIIFCDANNTINQKFLFFTVAIVFFVIVPTVLMIILKVLKKIRSFDVFERQERIFPMIIMVISYLIGFFILSFSNEVSVFLRALMLCYAVNTFIVLIITFWWKVSIHALAISGPIVALNFFFGNIIIPFYLLIILVGYSRVILKRHTIAQVCVGSFIGVFSTAIQMYFYLKLF